MILVGTSGFQHRDWVEVLYPPDLSLRNWLRYYSRHFGCCELGFTRYRMPEPTAIKELVQESGGALQFVFRVPERIMPGDAKSDEIARAFTAVVSPLAEAGQLAGALAPFGPEFEFMRDNFERLCRLRDSLAGISLIAEFGCRDWLSGRATRHLRKENIALACIDGPVNGVEKTLFCATASLGYVRFQGRRKSRWIEGDGSGQHDYLYSRTELECVVPEIRRLEQEADRVLVVMNNPWRGQAVINAKMLLEMLA